jgi:putative FmdB family regulatory protein
MPLYEYLCEVCSHRFERIQKFSDPLIDVCPSCGGTVKKLLSSPAIQFKGSGWYITDYAKKSSKDDGKESASTPAGDSKASEKTPATSASSESPKSGTSGSSGTGSSSGS